MNLMFQKKCRDGAAARASGTTNKSTSKMTRTNVKRSKDMGISNPDDMHYRTHILFSPKRAGEISGEGIFR